MQRAFLVYIQSHFLIDLSELLVNLSITFAFFFVLV